MPKYAIHHIVLNETIEKLRNGNADAQAAANLLEQHKFTANLGSIGPDLFFFASDYGIIGLVNMIMPAVEFLESVEEKIEEILEPIEEIEKTVEAAIDTTLDTLGLSVVTRITERLEDTERLIDSLLNQSIQSGLLQGIVPIQTDSTAAGQATSTLSRIVRELYENYLIPPLQNNYDEPDWYWFDMLHYRNVGDFSRNLLTFADTDLKKAYALAYLTHVGTDLVGHPFVNQIVGGPFRLGVQRHVTVENFMDVFEYRETVGRAVNHSLYDDLGFDDDSYKELDDDIAHLLTDAARETYKSVAHPLRLDGDGFFSADDVKDSYKLLRRALKWMANNRDLRPQPVEDTFDADLAEIIAAINGFDPPPVPPDLLPDIPDFSMEAMFSGEISLSDVAAVLAVTGQSFAEWSDRWIGYMGEFAFYCLQTALQLARLARSLIQIAANTLGRPLLVMLYGVQLALYDMYKTARHIMALNGLTYPDADMVDDAVSQSLIGISDESLHYIYTPGAEISKHNNKFPTLRIKGQSHLLAPNYEDECRLTTPAFHAPAGETPARPTAFIRDETFSAGNLQQYAAATMPTKSQELRDTGAKIGNAADLCAWMIEHAYAGKHEDTVFANWNLDGDRGYASKSWSGIVPHNADNSPVIQMAIAQASDTSLFPTDGMFLPDGTIEIDDDNTGYQANCHSYDDDTDDNNDYAFAKIKTKQEYFSEARNSNDFQIANMVIAESNVPDTFRNYTTRNAQIWASLLAPRLALTGNTWRENCYHVNGVGTPAYDALYERFNIQHFFSINRLDTINIKLLYNFTDNTLPFIPMGKIRLVDLPALKGEITSAADAIQAMQDKLWSYVAMWRVLGGSTVEELHSNMENAPLTFNAVQLPSILNATTIAVIALLHEGLRTNNPLGLIGYSHGTQILLNGMLAFAFQGQTERNYLKKYVKVFFVGRMVTPPSVTLLSGLVHDLQDLANPGDIIPDLFGNLPPDIAFLNAMSGIEVDLSNQTINSEMLNFISNLSAEQHKFYTYALRVKNDSPNHQGFF